MLNQTGFETKSYNTRKTILIDPQNSTALSCMVSDTGVTAGADGKKIVYAGTPVYGDKLKRNTPFTVSAPSGQTGAKPVGVILHDVDVTNGPANSQFVIFGTIDVSKITTTTAVKLKAAESDLKMIQLASRD